MYFKKIRNLHKAMMKLDEVARIQFKKETGFTEKEDSRAIGRGLHKSENRHYMNRWLESSGSMTMPL